MNTGQTILAVGAIFLMSFTIINVHRALTVNEGVLHQTRFGLEAVSLVTSIIEEASQLPFDEVSWDSTTLSKDVDDLTRHWLLGPESGETDYATFDDFDDFNGYTFSDTTLQNIYNISCDVFYISPDHPNLKEHNRTLYKRITVTVTSPSTADTLSMSYIHGYWYFN
ncbi:hypothetical protein JW960_03225 [candidate division KSB1 bacterium]|nr:hypothetical protein [candidate division KSB1 bacterium]